MSIKHVITTLAVIAAVNSATAQKVFTVTKGSIAFQSDAPLELIKAASTELRGKIDPAKKTFAFTVKVSSFKGFNSPLQREHFNENYLESGKYTDAFFSGRIIEDVNFAADGTTIVRAKGMLNVHGVPQERIIKSELTIRQGRITIKSGFTILLADHNIPIPKVVHEKLASEIKVEVKTEMEPQ